MSYTRRVLIIVPAADQAAANQAALQFDPVGGDNTFTVGLSVDGSLPATHYWSSTQMRDAVFQAVQAVVASQFPNAHLEEYTLGTNRAEEILVELNLQRITSDL